MILVGGENLIDFIQEPRESGYPAYRAIPGGAPFNVAKAVARQGARVGYLTPFSTDTLGTLLADHLLAEGVEELSPRSDRPTSLAVVSLTNGQAKYQFYREGTAERDVSAPGLRGRVPPGAEVFFVGSLAITDGADAEAWAATFEALGAAGLFTVLDPNIRAAFIHDRAAYLARLNRLIARADLIKLSDEDIAWIAPGEDPRAAAAAIFARSAAPLVVLTMGAEGAHAVTAGDAFDMAPRQVADLKDTVGAGDTFMGTLIAQIAARGLLAEGALAAAGDEAIRAILDTAARAAAINCGRVGCDPPTSAELGLG